MLASTLADFISLVIKQVIQNQDTLETEIDTDLIMCSTTSWVQSLEESKSVFQKPEQYSATVLIKVSFESYVDTIYVVVLCLEHTIITY